MHSLVAVLWCSPGCFALLVFLVSRDCCVALPHDATGVSAVCDCGISCSYSFTIFMIRGTCNFLIYCSIVSIPLCAIY